MGKHKKEIVGVYMIQNVVNKRVYIGSSTYAQRRLSDHRRKLKGNYHLRNKELQQEWNEYGESAFIFHILEEFDSGITEEDLLEQEYKWIIHFKAHENEFGFNKEDPRTRERIGKVNFKERERGLNINPVMGVNINTKEIIEFKNPYEASQSLNTNIKRIHECLSYWKYDDEGRRGRKKSHRNFIFVYKSQYDSDYDYLGYSLPPKQRAPRPKKEPVRIERVYKLPVNAKPVRLEHTETGEFLYYSSVKEAVRSLDLVESKARLSVKNEYKRYHHRGYWFKFISMEEYLENKSLKDIFLPEKSKHMKNLSS